MSTQAISDLNQPERIIRKKEVRQLTGLSDATIWRYERADNFPKRIQLGANSVGYSANEVHAWLEAKKEARHDA